MLIALVKKDFFALSKNLKVFLLLIILFGIQPSNFLMPFAFFYTLSLPVTTFGYDEKSNWNRYVKVLPIPEKTIVLSKYILGYVTIVGLFTVSAIAQFIYHAFNYQGNELSMYPKFLLIIVIASSLSALTLNIILPFMFKHGLEKGRLVGGLFLGIMLLVTFALSNLFTFGIMANEANLPPFTVLLIVPLLVIVYLSHLVSNKFSTQYFKRDAS